MPGSRGDIDRREAIRRVTALLGGVTLIGGNTLLVACERERSRVPPGESIGEFTPADIAFLDEVAETLLPETGTPGAKAVATGAFMALMVTDSYDERDQRIFRDGMRKIEAASRRAYRVSFTAATPEQRVRLLEAVDRDQKAYMDRLEEAERPPRVRPPRVQSDTTGGDAGAPEAYLPDQRREAAPGADVGAGAAITVEDPPPHYFRMMKELALLGYFTSETGCKVAQRYVESPGRFDPCTPYEPGERAWAPHA